MWGIALNLDWREFPPVFRQPRMLFIGLACQMLLLPCLAFLIALIFPMEPIYKVGLMTVAACPGGTSSNLITYLLRGKVALSVSLTTVNSALVLFTAPLIIGFSLNFFEGKTGNIALPIGRTMINIFCFVVLPVAIGLVTRNFLPRIANFLEKPLRYVLPAVLLGIFLGVVFTGDNRQEHITGYLFLLMPAFALNFLGAMAGFFVSNRAHAPVKVQYTIAIEVGLQNTALAIFISQGLLGQPKMAMVAVVYSSFSFFSTYLWAWLIRRYASDFGP